MHIVPTILNLAVALKILKIKVWGKASLQLEANAWRLLQHNPLDPVEPTFEFWSLLRASGSHTFWEQKREKDSYLLDDPS